MKNELDRLIEERMKQKQKHAKKHRSLTLYVSIFLVIMLLLLGSLWYFLGKKQTCNILKEKDITAVNKAFNEGAITETDVEKVVTAYYDHICFSDTKLLKIIQRYQEEE